MLETTDLARAPSRESKRFSLEAEDDDLRVVIVPFAHSQIQFTVDILACKQTYVVHLKTERDRETDKESHQITVYLNVRKLKYWILKHF